MQATASLTTCSQDQSEHHSAEKRKLHVGNAEEALWEHLKKQGAVMNEVVKPLKAHRELTFREKNPMVKFKVGQC